MYSHATFWTLLMLTVCSKSVTYVTNDFSVDLGLDNRTTRSEALRFQYSWSTPFFFIPRSWRISLRHIPPYTMDELRIYHLFVVYLSEGCVILNLLINSWTLFAVRNFSRTGDTKKVIHFQLLDCTRDEGTAKQIMMHNFAKDESGSFENVIWIQSQY